MSSLSDWNSFFESAVSRLATPDKVGAWLPVIPPRDEWEDFLQTVQASWRYQQILYQHYSLVALFCGVAFYAYEDRKFWGSLAQAVGVKSFKSSEQRKLEEYFAYAAHEIGLRILQRSYSQDYVGSAVYYIGIPLSLWHGFLQLCEWAWCHEEWRTLNEQSWTETVTRRTANQVRLQKFLHGNRDAATEFICALHDARRNLEADDALALDDIKQASLLRDEYFDEVPETADFLRPHNPESLFRHQPRLFFDQLRGNVRLELPALKRGAGVWSIGSQTAPAGRMATTIALDGQAWAEKLKLVLATQERQERHQLRGLAPFGLFDEERQCFVNATRGPLPLSRYLVLSPQPLDNLQLSQMAADDGPCNELLVLPDESPCYVTQLFPLAKQPKVSFTLAGQSFKLQLRPRAQTQARIFAGAGVAAAFFYEYRSDITPYLFRAEKLPLLCVALRQGFSADALGVLRRSVAIALDGDTELQANGAWQPRGQDESHEFFIWQWAARPFVKPRKAQVYHSLQELQTEDFVPVRLTGKHTLTVQAAQLGIDFALPLELLPDSCTMAELWRALPGPLWPFFVLCQPPGRSGANHLAGLSWDEIHLAQEILLPGQKISFGALRTWERAGLLEQRGRKWRIAESRAVLRPDGKMDFCGNPTLLWRLLRLLRQRWPDAVMPSLNLVQERGALPFLRLAWGTAQCSDVERFLHNNQVQVLPKHLWNE